MKNRLFVYLFLSSFLALCGCTVDCEVHVSERQEARDMAKRLGKDMHVPTPDLDEALDDLSCPDDLDAPSDLLTQTPDLGRLDGGCPLDAGSEPGGSVTLCHVPPGNPANAHTITVGQPAAAAHLRHGDYLGNCR